MKPSRCPRATPKMFMCGPGISVARLCRADIMNACVDSDSAEFPNRHRSSYGHFSRFSYLFPCHDSLAHRSAPQLVSDRRAAFYFHDALLDTGNRSDPHVHRPLQLASPVSANPR